MRAPVAMRIAAGIRWIQNLHPSRGGVRLRSKRGLRRWSAANG